MKSVLMIGAGQFAAHIAKRMTKLHCEIMVIDVDEARVNAILPHVTNAQIGDSTSREFLETLGIPEYDVCIVTIGNNFQTSLETTALLREMGARRIISRAQNDVQEKFLLRNGADETVYPEKQTAIRLGTKEASDAILDAFQIDRNVYVYRVSAPKEWNNKTIAELDIRRKYHLNIIAVRIDNELRVPLPDMVLHTGDHVVIFGSMKDIQRYFNI